MKRFFISAVISSIFLWGCGEEASSSKEPAMTVADSMKAANAVYRDLLVDISKVRSIRPLLSQGWEMEDDLDVIRDNGQAEGNYPFRSFYFSVDSSFVRNPRNFMQYGKWSFDEAKKTITLQYSNGGKDQYKIAALGAHDLVVINSGEGSVTRLKFVAAGKRYKHKEDDPYYIENNRWRIKPRFAETDEQVKKRLKDFLHFYVLYYRDNLAKEENIISFYGLPTCLKWYAGGIYMVKEEDLAGNWFSCFYSKEQAMKAYRMMEDLISQKYTWDKTSISWVKKNLLVLEQMYARL